MFNGLSWIAPLEIRKDAFLFQTRTLRPYSNESDIKDMKSWSINYCSLLSIPTTCTFIFNDLKYVKTNVELWG